MNQTRILTALYDLALVIGGQTQTTALLTRVLQRLMFHTSLPAGVVLRTSGTAENRRTRVGPAVGNRAWAALSGQVIDVPAEWVDGPVAELAHPGDWPPSVQLLLGNHGYLLRLPIADVGAIVLAGPSGFHSELPLTHVFQPILQNLSRSVYLCERHEAEARHVAAARDDARAELSSMVESFRRAQALAKTGSWELDVLSGRMTGSDESCRIWGIPPGTRSTPEQMQAIVHPDDRAKVVDSWTRALTGESSLEDDYRLVVAGEIRWVHARGEVLRDSNGAPVRIVGFVRDLTELRQATDALDRRERIYRAIIEQTHLGVMLHDAETLEFIEFNDATPASLGYTREEFSQLTVYDIQGRMTREQVDQAREMMIRDGGAVFENVHRCKNGELRTFQVSLRKIDVAGKIYLAAIWEDVTERRAEIVQREQDLAAQVAERTQELAQAKEVADLANQSKSAFLANMSHEIRTPMNAIIGLTQLMKRDVTEPAQVERLNKVLVAAKHLLEILNDILDLSKIDSGKLTLEESVFSTERLFSDVGTLVGTRAAERNLTWEMDPGDAPPMLCGDVLRLRQILLNFSFNAVKFTEHGGVQLRAKLMARGGEDVRVRFSVTDTGIGLSDEQRNRLFQAFMQADSSITRRFGGTGLGLAISSRLATLMNGAVGVESVPGEGSTFWVEVPLREASAKSAISGSFPVRAQTAQTPRSMPAMKSGETALLNYRPIRVLLAEDNPLNQEVALELLQVVRAQVDLADNGRQAVARAKDHGYDVILMDVQMPEMDGLAATRAIRAMPQHVATPILAMTASAFQEDRDACIFAGMNDHVPKPVDPDVLYKTLVKWLPDVSPAPRRVLDAADAHGHAAQTKVLESLTGLAGLDVHAGLRSVRDDGAAYVRLLEKFAHGHEDDGALIYRQVQTGANDEAMRTAHTLKGLAGTLGMAPLATISAEVEALLTHGVLDDTLLARVATLRTTLDGVVRGVLQALERQRDATPAAVATVVSYADLKQLAHALRADDLKAAEIARRLQPGLELKFGEDGRKLVRGVVAFQYDAALELTENLMERLN